MTEHPSNIPAQVIAQRFSDRAGCRYVGFREVGIPIFLMDLRAVVVENRRLSTVDEFLLRALTLGITLVNQLSSILGLPQAFVENRLADLRRLEFIDVTQTASDLRISLTETGKTVAAELSVDQLRETTIKGVPIHGWTRKPVPLLESLLLAPKEAEHRGLVQLRPVPARHPTADEVDVRTLARWAKRRPRRGTSETTVEVLGIRAVLKGVRTRFLPAILLQFESLGATRQQQVAFAVDGVLDDGLERIFAAIKGFEVFRDVLADRASDPGQLVEEHLPGSIRASVKQRLLPEQETATITALEGEIAIEQHQTSEDGKPDTRAVQSARIKELELERERLLKAAGSRPRIVHTGKCREVFLQSLDNARQRLLIVSAFIGAEVVNDSFVTQIDKAVRRGVKVFVVYGQSDPERMKRRSWLDAEERLRALSKRHKEAVRVEVGDTHAKMLVCDDQVALCGSFNFLSYRGEGRKVRDEKATLMTHPDDIEEVAKDILGRFS